MLSSRRLVGAVLVLALILFQAPTARTQTAKASKPRVRSVVTLMDYDGRNRTVLYQTDRHFEAPNWDPDGKSLLLNSEGKLWRLPLAGGEPTLVNTGDVKGINNDHGISPDGKTIALSAGSIYLVDQAGGTPRKVTEKTPSYYHGWSPDGRFLAYFAKRGDNFDLYRIGVKGGEEQRLTTHAGYDDGPDYSADGKWIYFNSDRSGGWDIWRIPAEGAGADDAQAERVTSDDLDDWFPHPSPDGKWIVFVSFPRGTKGHPANQPVQLRRMAAPGARAQVDARTIEVLDRFNGGQGTINVASWSPDSRRFAYIRYEILQP